MSDFKPVSLFGGAIVVDIPSTFQDVSDIRQVPDHQEVYLDAEGFSNIVFDLLERVDNTNSDVEALKYHLSDIVDDDAGSVKVWETAEARLAKMVTTPVVTLLATAPPGEKQRGRINEPDFVGILLVLVRLVEQKTDVLIAVNVPHQSRHYEKEDVDPGQGKLGPLLEAGVRVRQKVLETFEVKDWGLFVNE